MRGALLNNAQLWLSSALTNAPRTPLFTVLAFKCTGIFFFFFKKKNCSCCSLDTCFWVFFLNSRFRMLRLSSSSTLGLWLSLLRRNTRTTFWTMSTVRLLPVSPLNRFSFLHCALSREEPPMSPSRIQTAAVVLPQRRSPHLERPKKRDCPPSYCADSRCCMSGTESSGHSSLLSDSGSFQLGRDGLLGRDSPSFPGYSMHNS